MSAAMLPAAGVSAYDCYFHRQQMPGEGEAGLALLLAAAVGVLFGFPLLLSSRGKTQQLGRREALLLVALAWTIGAALSALPFRFWAAMHDFDPGQEQFTHYVDCYFEAMSGLTTTGASILTDIESIPRSLLFWRAFTHWIGGLGIVVLFVAVLPILGVGGKRLFRFEAPGPKKEGVRPRIRAAAQVLWMIYLGITLAEVIALRLAGLSLFDAVTHAFATLATGGFSTKNASIAAFGSWKVELIIIFFMFMAGVNFALYDMLLARRWREVFRNPEWRAYVWVMLVATLIIVVIVLGHPIFLTSGNHASPGFWPTLRHCLFTVVSIQTTTGFCTADFDQWGFPAQALLILLMFIGGCAGSTGGGIKVIRFVILVKILRAELETVFRPQVVRTVRVGRSSIDPQMRSATLVYFLLIGIVVLCSTGLVIYFETPHKLDSGGGDAATTAFSAVVANLNNIGPGLDRVGATCNYAWLTQPTKVLLCLLMALGRLELYAFLVLILPVFWRQD
jgi:trk system potassium uptake protein TrkH